MGIIIDGNPVGGTDGVTDTGGGGSLVNPGVPDTAALQAITGYQDCDYAFHCGELAFYYFDAASVALPAPPAVIIPDDITHPDPGRWLPVPAPAVPGTAGVECARVAFTFASASPVSLLSVGADDIVIDVEVVIETAFDGTAPTISVGDTSDSDEFLPLGQADPKTIGNYGSDTNKVYTAGDSVRLFLDPDGSTVGSGYVLVLYKDN